MAGGAAASYGSSLRQPKKGPCIGRIRSTDSVLYTKRNTASYDQASVTDFQQTLHYVVGVCDIQVANNYTIPTGTFIMASTDESSVPTPTAQHIIGVKVIEVAAGGSGIYHAVCFTGERDSYRVFKSSTWTEIARDNGGTWEYYDGNWHAADENNRLQALRQAFAVSANQMTATDLETISQDDWESSGGFVPLFTPSLSFAAALMCDGTNIPILQGYSVSLYDEGTAAITGWQSGDWTAGIGWSDGTMDGTTPFAHDGAVVYAGTYFEADPATLEGVQGYPFRLKFPAGLSINTTLTRVRVQYEDCQALQNLDDGFADNPAGFIVEVGSTRKDYSVEVIDFTKTDDSTAWLCDGDPQSSPTAFGSSDAFYVCSPARFDQLMLEPHHVNYNDQSATLSVAYWNGSQFQQLSITDGTAVANMTLAQKGVVSWTLPDDWKMHRPFDDSTVARGYWVKLMVSANLSAPTGIYEARVWDVPDRLPKYRYAVVAANRLFLANRPDAPSQIDISREREEFGFTGNDSASIHLGGDSITAVFTAWDNVIVCQPDQMRALTFRSPSEWNITKLQVTETPINSRVVVHAPLGGPQSAATTKQGLFFLNHRGAWVYSGLQADQAFATGQGVNLCQNVNWWDEDTLPRIDKNALHKSCGVYWPEKNWVIWSVPMITSSGQSSQKANNRLIVYDLNLGAWLPPFTIGVASLCVAYHCQDDAPGKLGQLGLYAGDYQGRILRLFSDTTDKDPEGSSVDVNAWVETGWMDFGHRSRKFLRTVSMIGETSGDEILVSFHRDGNASADTATVRFDEVANPAGQQAQFQCEPTNRSGRYWKWKILGSGPMVVHDVHLEMEADRDWPDMT